MRKNCLLAAAATAIALAAISSCAYATDEVALIIDKNLYQSCASQIERYKADVEAQFPVHLRICNEAAFESYTPAQMRDYIKGQYTTNGIKGVVLAGQIQYATWEQSNYNSGINSMYYEDMDGSFFDASENGVDDYHSWGAKAGPEIWCSWMRPQANDPINGMKSFLDKTHDYYTGNTEFEHRALIADSTDYDDNIRGAYGYQYPNLSKLYGNNIDVLGEGSALLTRADYVQKLEEHRYEIIDTFTHAWASAHIFDDGNGFCGGDAQYMDGGSIMTLIFGCHSAAFNELPSDNLAQGYVFGSNIGEVAIGTSWSFGITEKYAIYDVLNKGGYFGQGWLNLQKLVNTPDYIRQCYTNNINVNTYLWGQNMIGNPFVYANYTAPPVPEPSSILGLLIPGVGTLLYLRRRKP